MSKFSDHLNKVTGLPEIPQSGKSAFVSVFDSPVMKQAREAMNCLVNDFKELGDIEDLVQKLGKLGWFMTNFDSPGMYVYILDLVKKDDIVKVDEVLTKYYLSIRKEVISSIKSHHPELKNIMREISKCITLKMYHAAISLLLSSSEYIANKYASKIKGEKVTNILFNTVKRKSDNKRVPRISEYLKDELSRSDMIFKLTYSLSIFNGVNTSTEYLSSENAFNRHAILHGYNIEYGTLTNVCKALCFIFFIHLSLMHIATDNIKKKE